MKCTVVTMPGCPKCMQAKRELSGVTNVMFVMNSTIEGSILMKTHSLKYAPAFCFDDGFFTYSILEAKKRLIT